MSAQPREWLSFLQRFWPSALHVSQLKKLRMVLGVGLGMLFAGVLSQHLGQGAGLWLVAPIGASAELMFGLPSSPLAQPWSVVGGNTLSALVGTAVAFVWNGNNLVLAGALAVALAVAIMLWGRCLHPPGDASALLVVSMGEPSWHLVLFAFFLSSVLLVVGGLITTT